MNWVNTAYPDVVVSWGLEVQQETLPALLATILIITYLVKMVKLLVKFLCLMIKSSKHPYPDKRNLSHSEADVYCQIVVILQCVCLLSNAH